MVLEKIQKENDIKKLTPQELALLKDEIRQFLIESISVTGGHLASNLGVVELTMALHLCFNLPKDKIVWDVGHQSYTHKILTGRKDGFSSLRQYGGMSGFPKADEYRTQLHIHISRAWACDSQTGDRRGLPRGFCNRRRCADRRHGL